MGRHDSLSGLRLTMSMCPSGDITTCDVGYDITVYKVGYNVAMITRCHNCPINWLTPCMRRPFRGRRSNYIKPFFRQERSQAQKIHIVTLGDIRQVVQYLRDSPLVFETSEVRDSPLVSEVITRLSRFEIRDHSLISKTQ